MEILENADAGTRCGRPPRAWGEKVKNAPPEVRGRAAQETRQRRANLLLFRGGYF